jgi:hypothetical protein
MDFKKIRLFVNPEIHEKSKTSIIDLELFFKNNSSNLYYDFFQEDVTKANGLLVILCYSNLEQIANSIKNKLNLFLNNNKILIFDSFDLEIKWNELIATHTDLNFKNIHRISDNEHSNADIVIPCIALNFLDSNGYLYNFHKNSIKDKSFFCLMNISRLHRDLLVESLYNNNLLNQGKVVYHQCSNKTLQPLLTQQSKFIDLKNFKGCLPDNQWFDNCIGPDYLNNNLEIIVETTYKFPCITEKTVRPLLVGMPFLAVSCTHYLKYLRSIGFETYNDYFDESYDNEPNLHKRINLLSQSLKDILTTGIYNLFEDTKKIREHNLENLFKLKVSYQAELTIKLYNFIKNL